VQAIPKQAKVRLLEHLQKQQMPSAEFYYSQAAPEGGSEAEENIDATSASAAAAKAATSEPTSALSNDRETTDSVAAGVIAATTDQGMGSNVNAESAATKCICNALIEANISAEASLQYAKEMVQDGCDTVAILTSLVDEEQLELWRFKPFHRRALLKWIQQKNV